MLLDALDRVAERLQEIARVVVAAILIAGPPRLREHLLDRPRELREIEDEDEETGHRGHGRERADDERDAPPGDPAGDVEVADHPSARHVAREYFRARHHSPAAAWS